MYLLTKERIVYKLIIQIRFDVRKLKTSHRSFQTLKTFEISANNIGNADNFFFLDLNYCKNFKNNF